MFPSPSSSDPQSLRSGEVTQTTLAKVVFFCLNVQISWLSSTARTIDLMIWKIRLSLSSHHGETSSFTTSVGLPGSLRQSRETCQFTSQQVPLSVVSNTLISLWRTGGETQRGSSLTLGSDVIMCSLASLLGLRLFFSKWEKHGSLTPRVGPYSILVRVRPNAALLHTCSLVLLFPEQSRMIHFSGESLSIQGVNLSLRVF